MPLRTVHSLNNRNKTNKENTIKNKLLTKGKTLQFPCFGIKGVRCNGDIALIRAFGGPQVTGDGDLSSILETNLDLVDDLLRCLAYHLRDLVFSRNLKLKDFLY